MAPSLATPPQSPRPETEVARKETSFRPSASVEALVDLTKTYYDGAKQTFVEKSGTSPKILEIVENASSKALEASRPLIDRADDVTDTINATTTKVKDAVETTKVSVEQKKSSALASLRNGLVAADAFLSKPQCSASLDLSEEIYLSTLLADGKAVAWNQLKNARSGDLADVLLTKSEDAVAHYLPLTTSEEDVDADYAGESSATLSKKTRAVNLTKDVVHKMRSVVEKKAMERAEVVRVDLMRYAELLDVQERKAQVLRAIEAVRASEIGATVETVVVDNVATPVSKIAVNWSKLAAEYRELASARAGDVYAIVKTKIDETYTRIAFVRKDASDRVIAFKERVVKHEAVEKAIAQAQGLSNDVSIKVEGIKDLTAAKYVEIKKAFAEFVKDARSKESDASVAQGVAALYQAVVVRVVGA